MALRRSKSCENEHKAHHDPGIRLGKIWIQKGLSITPRAKKLPYHSLLVKITDIKKSNLTSILKNFKLSYV
jgi:hypothetical protein